MYSLTNVDGVESLELTTLMDINEEQFSNFIEKHKHRIKRIMYINKTSFYHTYEYGLVSKTLKHLKVLKELSHFEMKNFSSQVFNESHLPFFDQLFEHSQNLETFFLMDCNFKDYIVSSIVASLSMLPNIKQVTLEGVRMKSFESLSQMLIKTTTLTALDVISCNLTLYDISSLSSALLANTTLRSLQLGGFPQIPMECLRQISQLPNLQTLSFQFMKISTEGVKIISDALVSNCTLTELGLYNTELELEGISLLNDGLKRNFGLKVLNIGNNNIRSTSKKTREYTEIITEILKHVRYLDQLDISESSICTPKSLLDALRITKVSSLKLDGNRFTPPRFSILMKSLKRNKNLKSLSISFPKNDFKYFNKLADFKFLEKLMVYESIKCDELILYQSLLNIPSLSIIILQDYSPKSGKLLGDFIAKKLNLKRLIIGMMGSINDFQPVIEGMEQNKTLIAFKATVGVQVEEIQFYLNRNKLEITGIKEHLKYFEMTTNCFLDIKFHFRNKLKRKIEEYDCIDPSNFP